MAAGNRQRRQIQFNIHHLPGRACTQSRISASADLSTLTCAEVLCRSAIALYRLNPLSRWTIRSRHAGLRPAAFETRTAVIKSDSSYTACKCGAARPPISNRQSHNSVFCPRSTGGQSRKQKYARQRRGPATLPCAASTKRRTAYPYRRLRTENDDREWARTALRIIFAAPVVTDGQRSQLTTNDAARASLFEYIEVPYNRVRSHSALCALSPEQYEQHG